MRKVLLSAALAAVVLAAIGLSTAGAGGDQSRVWAQVDPGNGTPSLVKASGIVSVTSPITGTYCLRAAPGIDLVHAAPVASQEVSLSTELGFVTTRSASAAGSSCPDGQLQVVTWAGTSPGSPTLIGTVGFDVIVR